MSEKMREEFDLWAQHELGYCAGEKTDGTYYVTKINDMWQAWKASRAALVVELPSDINGEYYADGWNAALMCVEEILKDSGVSYK